MEFKAPRTHSKVYTYSSSLNCPKIVLIKFKAALCSKKGRSELVWLTLAILR